jgi:hypothetical protein
MWLEISVFSLRVNSYLEIFNKTDTDPVIKPYSRFHIESNIEMYIRLRLWLSNDIFVNKFKNIHGTISRTLKKEKLEMRELKIFVNLRRSN